MKSKIFKMVQRFRHHSFLFNTFHFGTDKYLFFIIKYIRVSLGRMVEGGVELISSLLAAQRFIFVQSADQIWVEKLDVLLTSFHSLLSDFKQQIVETEQDDYEQQSKNDDIGDANFEVDLEFKKIRNEEASKTVHHKEKYDKETAKNILKNTDMAESIENITNIEECVENKKNEGIEQNEKKRKKTILRCSFCQILFKQKYEIKKHDQENHIFEDKFLCPANNCGYMYVTKYGLMHHFYLKHTDSAIERGFVCPCSSCQRQVWNVRRTVWKCEVCSKKLNTIDRWNHHKLIHEREKDLECEICKKTFRKHIGLKYHRASVHKIGEEMKCRECDKVFYNRYGLSDHMRRMHQNKKYICEFCDHRTSDKYKLDRHIAHMHTEDAIRNEICEECGCQFFAKEDLKRHIERVHMKVRNHKCDFCQKSFFSIYTRDYHMKIHTGQKDYKCRYCNKQFIQKVNRKTHEKKRHSK